MKKRSAGCVLVPVVILLLLCVGGGIWAMTRGAGEGPLAYVQIQNPQSSVFTEVNNAVSLLVYAEGEQPIARLEVYADGALIGAANGNGSNSLTLAQPWTPTTTGRHVLVARAFLSADIHSDSSVVFVDVADLSALPVQVNVDDIPRGEGVTEVTVGDLAAAAGTNPEEIARLNPGIPPAPGAVIPPGSPVSLPRRSPPPPAGAPAIPPPAPGAPGMHPEVSPSSVFEGETHSCTSISLRWRDAPDETEYALYRLAPGEDLMSEIARVPANGITFTDSPITRIGTYHYFLAPLRPSGGSISSMISVEISPDCSPAGLGGAVELRLTMLNLTTVDAYEGVYCYVSINGSRYERIPAGVTLLRPTSGDLSYDLPMQMPNRGQYNVTAPAGGLVQLEGECWGRRGVESLRLGRFAGSHASPEWDGRDLTSEVAFMTTREVASTNAIPPKSGGASFLRYRIGPVSSPPDLSLLYNGVINLPPELVAPIRMDSPTVPAPTNLRIQNLSMGFCDDLPSEAPGIGASVCGAQVVRNLAWDWNPTLAISQTQVTGFIVITSIQDTLSATPAGADYSRMVQPGTARNTPVPSIPSGWRCGATLRFSVRAITDLGTSEASAPLTMQQPPCNPSSRLYIRVDNIFIEPSAASGEVRDDGDICILCTDRRFELFGFMALGDANTTLGITTPPSHDIGTLTFGSCPHNTYCREAGSSAWYFETYYPIRNQPLTFGVFMQDYDTGNGPDLFCSASGFLAQRSAEDWSRTTETLTLQSDYGEASCRFEIVVFSADTP